MVEFFITIVLIIFVTIVLLSSIHTVPISKIYVIERAGKFLKTCDSGLIILIPFIDKIKYKLNKKESLNNNDNTLEFPGADNQLIEIKLNNITYSIIDAEKYSYSHSNPQNEIEYSILLTTKSLLKKYYKTDLIANNDSISEELKTTLNNSLAEPYGIAFTEVQFEIVKN